MVNLDILELKKRKLNYFVNDADTIRDKGIARFSVNVNHKGIKSMQDDSKTNLYLVRVEFDLTYLDSEIEIENNIDDEFGDTDVAARLQFSLEGIVKSDDFKEENKAEFHNKILSVLEPYIRKEIDDFTNETDIPKFPLPYSFWDDFRNVHD